MKRAFVSYSIEDRNLHLITLLLEHLRKNDYVISVSNQDFNNNIIINADIFIGIITKNNSSNKFVISECQIAHKNNIPFILVVEKGVKRPSGVQSIVFDRSNPQAAINQLFKLQQPITSLPKANTNGDSTSKVLIGIVIIAGIAALLSLLSQNASINE